MLGKLIKFSASYAAVEGIQKGILFLLTPVFTSYMTQEEYGVVASVLMLVPFCIVIFSLSIQASITRYYYKYKNDEEKLRNFLGTNFSLLSIVSLGMLIIAILAGEHFWFFFFNEIKFYPYGIYALIIGSVQPIVIAYFSLLKAMQKLKEYTILFNLYFASQVILMLVSIIIFNMKQDGYILSMLSSNIIFFIIVFSLLAKKVNWGIKFNYVKESLKYCLPIIPVDGIGLISSLVDRYFILNFIGLSAVGAYFVGYQIAMLVSLISLAINSAYTPIFFSKYESDQSFNNIYRLGEIIVYITSFFAMILSVLSSDFINLFFDSSYQSSNDVVVYLAFCGALRSVYFLNTNVLSIDPNLVKLKTVGIIFGTCITVFLGYVMTINFGLQGAACSTMLGFLVTTIILISIVNKKTDFKFKSFKSILFITLMFFLTLYSQIANSMTNKVIYILLFPLLLLALFEKNKIKKVFYGVARIK